MKNDEVNTPYELVVIIVSNSSYTKKLRNNYTALSKTFTLDEKLTFNPTIKNNHILDKTNYKSRQT